MRRYAILLAMAVAPSVGAPTSAAAQADPADDAPIKVGVINLDAVALRSPAGQALTARLDTIRAEVAAEVEVRQVAVRQLEARVAEADSLTVDERRELEREYQDAITDFQRYQQDKQEEVNALQAEGQAQIRAEIGPVIEALQVELGYDLILHANSATLILFSDRVDITQLTIDRLTDAGS